MAKPDVIPPDLDAIPAELCALPQWIVWKHHFHKKRKVWIKLPLNPVTGKAASTTDPSSWATFDAAATAYELMGGYDGVGFVFKEGGGLVGIDIDKCYDGVPNEMAVKILEAVPGYQEVSPSGTGIHIITRADLPRAYKDDKIGLELYTKGRYFTITGVAV